MIHSQIDRKMFIWLLSFYLVSVIADTSQEICGYVNHVRQNNGLLPFTHSTTMRYIAEAHLYNLISNGYDPFVSNKCDPHSWFANETLGISDCCYPLQDCMGDKGKRLTNYRGHTIENFHAQRASGGFFGGIITTSGITALGAVNGWEVSPLHLAAMLNPRKVCGAAIMEYRTNITAIMYQITGMAVAWFGDVADILSNPTLSPSESPSKCPTLIPTRQPSAHPTFTPSSQPSPRPTLIPTRQPSDRPTLLPTMVTSKSPTIQPILFPTLAPVVQYSTTRPTTPIDHISQDNSTATKLVTIVVWFIIITVIAVCLFLMLYCKVRLTQATPQPLQERTLVNRGLQVEPRFHKLVQGMLDPNDPDDQELLRAKSTHQMARILKRQRMERLNK